MRLPSTTARVSTSESEPELVADREVTLDFDGVSVFASPFLNAAIGQLLKDVRPEDLNRLLRIEKLNPTGDRGSSSRHRERQEVLCLERLSRGTNEGSSEHGRGGLVAVNYRVQADVIDIRSDVPRSTDAFLVDSNVWFWMTYAGAGLANDREAKEYPPYVKHARKQKAKLLRCGLSMAELTHIIERTAHEIFGASPISVKSQRNFGYNFAAERGSVVTDVQAAWRIVKSMASPLDAVIDDPVTDVALARVQTQLLDGYDLFIAEAMPRANIPQVLTDDGDYCTIPGIQVFTANRNVIVAATAQGRLVKR